MKISLTFVATLLSVSGAVSGAQLVCYGAGLTNAIKKGDIEWAIKNRGTDLGIPGSTKFTYSWKTCNFEGSGAFDVAFINTPSKDPFADYVSLESVIEIANGTRFVRPWLLIFNVDTFYRYSWLENITGNALADCWAMAIVNNVPAEDFILWNPSLRTDPSKSAHDTGFPCTLSASSSYCVALASPTTEPVQVAAPPSPRAAGEIANCTAWYQPESFHTCESVLARGYLTIEQFYSFNPSVKSDCTGMVIGTYYCISTEADGSPPPSDEDEESIATATKTGTAPTITAVATPTPVQSGMVSKCNRFCKVISGDGCWAIADTNDITLDDFYSWNLAVKTDCSGLQADFYVCIGISAAGGTTTAGAATTTAGGISPSTPTPMQEGMISGCDTFYKVQSGDGCWAIADANGITLDKFYLWNPAVKTDCTGLQADVYVCIGLTVSPTTAPTPGPTTTAGSVATPAPVQDGMTANCAKFYFVQPGDGCWAIADENGILLGDFYSWNPSVKTDCTGLQANVYVCIGVA